MRLLKAAFLTPATAVLGLSLGVAAQPEKVPLYTGEDLDRMFGPAPASPSVPVDKTRPEDWRWVEQFLDREYARIDADRQHDLNRRESDVASQREEGSSEYYGGSLLWGWGGGYPGYSGYGGLNVSGPGYGRGDRGGVGGAVCRGSGYRLGRASVATSIRRAGISRPSHRH
jgi:hypothetical protein